VSNINRELTEDELSIVAGTGKWADAAVRGAVAGGAGAASGQLPSTIDVLHDIYVGNHQI
jgi:hypothetical protein